MSGMDREAFDRYGGKKDEWNDDIEPNLKLDDLDERDDDLPIKLSIMMSINDYRRSQLARSLECLCRQNWKEFEVLVCDNGSKQDLESIFEIFRPFLRLKTVRLERGAFSASPARGFKTLMPMAEGEIWAIMQPEVMLVEDAAEFLYRGHELEGDDWKYTISTDPMMTNSQTWITLKTGFFDDVCQRRIDDFNWHDDIRQIEQRWPAFWQHIKGLSNKDNHSVLNAVEWPWWFVGSARASAGIWSEMPTEIRGHATIDLWMLNYRNVMGYIDICPPTFMGYHQFHFRTNVGLEGEIAEHDVTHVLRSGVRDRAVKPVPLSESVPQSEIIDLCFAPPSEVMESARWKPVYRPSEGIAGLIDVPDELEASSRIMAIRRAAQKKEAEE